MGTRTQVRPGRVVRATGLEPPAPRVRWVLVGLLVFQGLGATGGGAMLVADPSGQAMGWTTDMISRTPFATYTWPGIILGTGLGLTALVLAWGVARRPAVPGVGALERGTGAHWSWAGSVGLGVGLMAWIVVQLVLIDVRTFLQPLMFVVGAAIAGTALLPSVRRWLTAGVRW